MSLPLSSLATIAVTPETRERLEAAGVDSRTIDGLSEQGGLNLLALKASIDEEGDTPACFRLKYDPRVPLCVGCVVSPRCWRGDRRYLGELEKAGALAGGQMSPPDADQGAIESAIARMRSLPDPAPRPSMGKVPARPPTPPVPKLPTAPPPPRRMLPSVPPPPPGRKPR